METIQLIVICHYYEARSDKRESSKVLWGRME